MSLCLYSVSLSLSFSLTALLPLSLPLSLPSFFLSFPSTDGENYVSHPVFLPSRRAEYLPLNDFFLHIDSLQVKDIRLERYAERVSCFDALFNMSNVTLEETLSCG